MAEIRLKHGVAPDPPPIGYSALYVGDDGRYYSRSSDGTITPVYGVGPQGPAGPLGPPGLTGPQGNVSSAKLFFFSQS